MTSYIPTRYKSCGSKGAKNWSQEELASRIEASMVMVGKYERGDNLPSIEVLVKLAGVFEVSVDFLIGTGANASYDREMVRRLDDMQSLPEEAKKRIFEYVDLVIRDFKTKNAFGLK